MNKKILKLENNKEYFMISSLVDNGVTYLLLINVDDETDIKICKKVTIENDDSLIDIKQGDILEDLKLRFKDLVNKDKSKYI